jgi:hypothetical protein
MLRYAVTHPEFGTHLAVPFPVAVEQPFPRVSMLFAGQLLPPVPLGLQVTLFTPGQQLDPPRKASATDADTGLPGKVRESDFQSAAANTPPADNARAKATRRFIKQLLLEWNQGHYTTIPRIAQASG